ncbi:hypothetical protein AVEN_230287-1 [Araneus ventricosus]|uniref:CCHC-type domain-containing protein n=1 Tax=Araneus ventricosus TaxID=182803 RepID=A0A4Y2SEW3_ARAVE|nr:hypothetical protein AVEN_230287-1 [Araneus ventricosus]
MLLSNLAPEIQRGVIAANPKTIDEIKEAAFLQERARNSYRPSPSCSVSNKTYPSPVYAVQVRAENANQCVEDFCHKLVEKVETLTTKVTDLSRQQNKQQFCYSCNRSGQIARFCTRKYSSRKNQLPDYREMIRSFRYGRNSHPSNYPCILPPPPQQFLRPSYSENIRQQLVPTLLKEEAYQQLVTNITEKAFSGFKETLERDIEHTCARNQ